jgi:hypothetical protein
MFMSALPSDDSGGYKSAGFGCFRFSEGRPQLQMFLLPTWRGLYQG